MTFTKYELANKNRPAEILDQLGKLKQDKDAELQQEITTVIDLFFGQIPKGLTGEYQNTDDLVKEWILLHENNQWECEDGEKYTETIKNLTLIKFTNKIYKNKTTKEIHTLTNFIWQYESARRLIRGLASLENWIEKLSNNIANSEALNSYLLSDTLEFNEALFLLLGFNPIDQLTLTLDRHKHDSIDFVFTSFIFNNDITEYKRLNKGWEKLENNEVGFIEWAIEKDFFVKFRSIIKPEILKELHKLLVDNFLIENSNFSLWKKWQWIKKDALLRYLISEIHYTNETNNFIIYPSNENIFDIILEQIQRTGSYDMKKKSYFTKIEVYPDGHEIIDKLIKKLIENIK